MALFKILKGNSTDLANAVHREGYVYFTSDEQKFYIGVADNETPVPLNANLADVAKKVNQRAIVSTTSYSYWRPLLIGGSASATEGFTPSNINDNAYTFAALSVQPNSGTIRATKFKGDGSLLTNINYSNVINKPTFSANANAILIGTGADGFQGSNIEIRDISTGPELFVNTNFIITSGSNLSLNGEDIIKLYGVNDINMTTDNNELVLDSNGINIETYNGMNSSVNISAAANINLTSNANNINITSTNIRLLPNNTNITTLTKN